MREIFPTFEKCSVTPIYKSGNLFNVVNYSPISIFHHLSKVFESIVYTCIKRSLSYIIIYQQHGFRSDKSTATSSVVFTFYI